MLNNPFFCVMKRLWNVLFFWPALFIGFMVLASVIMQLLAHQPVAPDHLRIYSGLVVAAWFVECISWLITRRRNRQTYTGCRSALFRYTPPAETKADE